MPLAKGWFSLTDQEFIVCFYVKNAENKLDISKGFQKLSSNSIRKEKIKEIWATYTLQLYLIPFCSHWVQLLQEWQPN